MNICQNPVAPFWEKPESRRLEFKETFPKSNQIAKTAIAFANGGKIVRDNPREIVGIPDAELFLLEEPVHARHLRRCHDRASEP